MRVIAFGWVQSERGSWDRYLVRKSKTGNISTDLIHWVDTNYLVCMYCLGQNIEVRPELPTPYMQCINCGEYCPNDHTAQLQPLEVENATRGYDQTI